ncbi:TPA: phage terminase small subunit [Morganella morganii]
MGGSIFRRHVMRISAQQDAQQRNPQTQTGTAYTQMTLMMNADRRRLKRIQSFEKKAAVKREMLPNYAPWVGGILASGRGQQDDVLMRVMLWRIDAGDFHGALDIADYVLRHGLKMPENHNRTTGCAIAEEIADMAEKLYAAKTPVPLDVLIRTQNLTGEEDMPDQVRANLMKWLGYAQRDDGQLQPATCSWLRALELYDRVGVKQDLRQLEKLIEKQQAESGTVLTNEPQRRGGTAEQPTGLSAVHRPPFTG